MIYHRQCWVLKLFPPGHRCDRSRAKITGGCKAPLPWRGDLQAHKVQRFYSLLAHPLGKGYERSLLVLFTGHSLKGDLGLRALATVIDVIIAVIGRENRDTVSCIFAGIHRHESLSSLYIML